VKYAAGIAAGNDRTSHDLVGHERLQKEHEFLSPLRKEQRMIEELNSKTFADKNFSEAVKAPILLKLFAAGIVHNWADPRWNKISAQQSANLLAQTNWNSLLIDDATMRFAVSYAPIISHGDLTAAKMLVVHSQASETQKQQEMEEMLKQMPHKPLSEPDFNLQTKLVLLKILAAVRKLERNQEPAIVFMMLGGVLEQMTPVVLKTIRTAIARKVGLTNAAIKLRILPGSVITELQINAAGTNGTKIAEGLISLWERGTISTVAGLMVKHIGFDMPTISAEVLATQLVQLGAGFERTEDPLVNLGIALAHNISRGDSAAAQRLLGYYRFMIKRLHRARLSATSEARNPQDVWHRSGATAAPTKQLRIEVSMLDPKLPVVLPVVGVIVNPNPKPVLKSSVLEADMPIPVRT